ncbi:helicase HerA domain-containing protein [Staphylococcus petrasii]|uniref:helicase HerA domain-containing protein n=1 Tax=Staphylococcus petrasii TaxID=1276936 RepID=UPI003F66F574
MSNQFYNFLDKELRNYLNNTSLNAGDRFFLILNNDNEINNLKTAIENSKEKKVSTFKSNEFSFETIYYMVNDKKVIFVFAHDGVTNDFLVTIRNKVSLQKGEWEDSVVIFLMKEDLDSITGGSLDLSKKGAPFHTNSLKQNLDKIVNKENHNLEKHESEILKFVIERKFSDELVKYTLLDFESVFSIIQQGEINKEDYLKLELFEDKQLKSFSNSTKNIKNRLIENSDLFETVSAIHDRGNIKEDIEEKFGESAPTKLVKDNWYEAEFEPIRKSKETVDNEKRVKIEFNDEEFYQQFKNIEVWNKNSGTTKVKSREKNIIIFKEFSSLETIILPFDKNDDINPSFINTNRAKVYNLATKETSKVQFKSKSKGKLVVDLNDLKNENEYFIEFTYKHNNSTSLTFKFRILLVNFDSSNIENLKTKYKLKYNTKEKQVEITLDNVENLLTINNENNNQIKVFENGETYNLNEFSTLDFSPLVNADVDNIYINLKINVIEYIVRLNEFVNKPVPVSSSNLIKKVFEKKESMIVKDNIAIQDTNEYYLFNEFKIITQIEKVMIENNFTNGVIKDNQLVGETKKLPPLVEKEYKELCELIIQKKTVPSLMYYDEDIKKAVSNYCESIEDVFKNLTDNEKITDKEILNIHELGTVTDDDNIYLTSLHPLILRYELNKTERFNDDEISEKVFRKYNPIGLLPYFVDVESNYYFANYNEGGARWITYKPFETTNKMSSEKMQFIIKTRLNNYKQHFRYLFDINNNYALKVKYIDVKDYKAVIKGTIEHLLDQMKDIKSIYYLNPVNIYLDVVDNIDNIYTLYNIKNSDELLELYNIKIPSNIKKKFNEEDILETIKSKINIFTNKQDENIYHITFFNFNQEPKFSVSNLREIYSSITNKGLLSNISYTKIGNSYLSGFGTKGILENNDLINSALLWNSFVSNNKNYRLNPYKKDEGIVNNVISIENQNLDDVFNDTNWVTFIDPSVDLSYFNSNEYDLYVIHYNDQTSSFNYESITVTNDTEQYSNILKEFLNKVNVDYTPQNIDNIIRSFNILNGEWLLSVIGNRGSKSNHGDHSIREKLSIISAYKQVLSILTHEKITWIPISMEEVLRVSRQQGLDASSDVFSAKELNHTGSISDDLLFIGLELEEDNVNVHFMPVEVKVGINHANVIDKAKEQISHLFKVLEKELITPSTQVLTQDFYRQFFLNLYFGNLNKFIENGVIVDERMHNIYEKRAEILNGNITFSTKIKDEYGIGIAVLFNQENSFRKLIKDNEKNVYELHLTELDAYNDAEKDFKSVKHEILNNQRGIDLANLLVSHTDDTLTNEKNDIPIPTFENESKEINNSDEVESLPNNDELEELSDNENIDTSDNESIDTIKETQDFENNLENVRILLGNAKGSTEKVYWEYGHKQLPNRHILISGKSGQGKTYFMQCLLYEMAKNKLDSLVVDYTDGFLHNQLEEEFTRKLGDKLNTKFIFRDKLPINPFKRNEIDLGGFTVPEENDDIADRVVQIIDFVFKLGIQQSSLLKESIKSGLDIYGESFTFTKLKQRLIDQETANATTLVGRIDKLLDKDPFAYNNNDFTWKEVFNNEGKVTIMQLKGFVASIQKVITEFLLWDLYNFTEREGSKNVPIPVLLDEMQNLNHKESSPTTKILKEGRKFGWSSWLATQSISSIKNNGGDISALFNAAEQVHFAPPEDQIAFISKNKNNDEKRKMEQDLSSLNKGECLVIGFSNINGELIKKTEIVEVTSLEDRE